ncbi:glycine oxidase ThiO [Salipaludibacillus keqinensis]|uniref:glycine oxidase n=1 Tax=Salipaludibacillus keqinensis TaxID=2045207 RepID=A0A323T8H2_9BACI|nr:glycine oxidase ThiO [Salipaludibacillus keqinensis]PYZ92088.1 glycine oxidase ThiO [Salipaludibacillus keqinensis]
MKEHILILGGGVIGLASAFSLIRRGFEVTILEKNTCGGQASGAAAGMLAPYSEIMEDPDPFFTFCLDSLRMFRDWQQEIKKASGVDFEYTESGSIYGVYHDSDILSLETRIAWQKTFGSEAQILDGSRLKSLEPAISDEVVAAIYSNEESHVFAPDYVHALKVACEKLGVNIYENLGDIKVESWQSAPILQSPSGQTFTGDKLVICSGAWSQELETIFHIRIPVFPIRGQICAYELGDEQVNHILTSSQGYLVPKSNGTLVNGASEDIAGFSTTVTEKGISRLVNWNKRMLPFLSNKSPFHTWAGLRPATQDGFPLLGSLEGAPHIIFATGHYRNGILLSPKTGETVADLISGIPLDPGTRLAFQPERFN